MFENGSLHVLLNLLKIHICCLDGAMVPSSILVEFPEPPCYPVSSHCYVLDMFCFDSQKLEEGWLVLVSLTLGSYDVLDVERAKSLCCKIIPDGRIRPRCPDASRLWTLSMHYKYADVVFDEMP